VTDGTFPERSRWKIHGERVIDDSPHVKVSMASVTRTRASGHINYET
jgi:hypothetical protein